jgi:hypothetical protein
MATALETAEYVKNQKHQEDSDTNSFISIGILEG